MSGIEITRSEFTASDLRMAAGKSLDAKAARRMLALALVLEGVDRTRAAQTCGMDRQTLRDWVHRYNAEGLAGLSDRRKGVRVPRLVPAQMADLAAWVEAGPDPEKDGVVRWRRQDLQRRIAEAFGVEVHERTVGKYLAALGYRRLSVRPQHPRTDPGAQETFKRTSTRQRRRRPPRPHKAGPSIAGSRSSAWCRHGSEAHGGRACWSTGHAHPYLGQARYQTPCAPRYPLSMGVRRFSRTMYGWLPRGKGVSGDAGVISVAAMYTASGLQRDCCAP
jgi:transposase